MGDQTWLLQPILPTLKGRLQLVRLREAGVIYPDEWVITRMPGTSTTTEDEEEEEGD